VFGLSLEFGCNKQKQIRPINLRSMPAKNTDELRKLEDTLKNYLGLLRMVGGEAICGRGTATQVAEHAAGRQASKKAA
jgi:hypothetical protein